MYKPMLMKPQKEQPQQMVTIRKWAGINQLGDPSEIELNEWPVAQNVQLDTLGAIEKRYGYQLAIPSGVSGSPIMGMTFFNGNMLVVAGGNLYAFTSDEYK